MGSSGIASADIARFRRDGYLLIDGLFDADEVRILLATAQSDQTMADQAQELKDGEGGNSKLSLWYRLGDDTYGLFGRCHRVANMMESLLGDQLCHFHSKIMLKEPRVGGAWSWHQDYGYWYHSGFPFADQLGSCLIAIDEANRDNGCLQVLRGSHRLGRLHHVLTGDQTGADPEWVDFARGLFELDYCTMTPGSVLFFHSNLLHRSDQNRSDHPRWSLICCYTTVGNLPFKDFVHPGYEPLRKVTDGAIKEAGVRPLSEDAAFLASENLNCYNERLAAHTNTNSGR